MVAETVVEQPVEAAPAVTETAPVVEAAPVESIPVEEAAPVVTETPVVEAAPAPVTPEEAAPAPVEPAPAPEYVEPTPEPAPAPEYVEPTPEPAPAPEYVAPTPEPAPTPEYVAPAPEPTPEPAPAPVDPNADLNSSIANAALGMVGTTNGWQCTQVATGALNAAGVGAGVVWPSEYIQYGYYVDPSQAVAGNLIYYNNGGNGYDHIAVYIGDGQAVHGNYDGQTVVADAYLSTAGSPQFIQIAQ